MVLLLFVSGFVVAPIVCGGGGGLSLFCNVVLSVLSFFVIISLGKRVLVDLL